MTVKGHKQRYREWRAALEALQDFKRRHGITPENISRRIILIAEWSGDKESELHRLELHRLIENERRALDATRRAVDESEVLELNRLLRVVEEIRPSGLTAPAA